MGPAVALTVEGSQHHADGHLRPGHVVASVWADGNVPGPLPIGLVCGVDNPNGVPFPWILSSSRQRPSRATSRGTFGMSGLRRDPRFSLYFGLPQKCVSRWGETHVTFGANENSTFWRNLALTAPRPRRNMPAMIGRTLRSAVTCGLLLSFGACEATPSTPYPLTRVLAEQGNAEAQFSLGVRL